MTDEAEGQRNDILSGLHALIRSRWPEGDRDRLIAFVDLYLQRVATEDLLEKSVADLYGSLMSHWNLGVERRPGMPAVRVYNPAMQQDGWESTHSVVQIVTDDIPFLVDSTAIALNQRGLNIHLTVHPLLTVHRSEAGTLESVADVSDGPAADPATASSEAWLHIELDRQAEPSQLTAIADAVSSALEDCRLAVGDWSEMHARLQQIIAELQEVSVVPTEDREEIRAFLQWLLDDHFTFLGYRCYDLTGDEGQLALTPVEDASLGILRKQGRTQASQTFNALPPAVRALALEPDPLILTKSNHRATVHRNTHMDYVGIKRFAADGTVMGEHRFLGLYTSTAYYRPPESIPLLRRKIAHVLKRARLPRRSHDGKALANILVSYPRDELFQIDADTLFRISSGILQLQDRQRLRLFLRTDTYQRFVSCLVFAPRERYDSDVRRIIQNQLQETFHSTSCEFSVHLSETPLARIHFILHVDAGRIPPFDHGELERRLSTAIHDWRDDLKQALIAFTGEARGNRLFRAYGDGFSAAYREAVEARSAAHDIDRLERLEQPGRPGILLYRPLEAGSNEIRLRLYRLGAPITLSDILPLLENMGVRVLDERPFAVHPLERPAAHIHDFGLYYHSDRNLDIGQLRQQFEESLEATWLGRIENDGFNRLVLAARLDWRDIHILRAYCGYLRQAGTAFSQRYMEDTLVGNPGIARLLIRLFQTRFDPQRADRKRAGRLAEQIELALVDVPSLDEDRILRRLLAAITATLRTNAYCTDPDGMRRDTLSFKLNPSAIPNIPLPVPMFEIFVYSARVEGVHLRGGRVARGGLRWSDRREDYRTEILGLMKAQTVKNAVIVPVGAKGGFVCKALPAERDAIRAEVQACYRSFIRGLLDITDNLVGDAVVPPADVVRHDDDDPYLVVAADKGTATFSDLANSVAEDYGFWLRDAFASGGSNGYDHKRMGITARGAWEAVKRHFREIGRDIQRQPFRAVGIGDMSGDVFGNGMLLSRQTRLIAAFDHRHIFIDPDPDPELGYGERERLFALPASSWDDYNRSCLSAGGAIHPRSLKSINLSPEARRALGIDVDSCSPASLIQAILKAPVDLLWNGGIGTYVKATGESHQEIGDRANDGVRVDARDLRCKVVGEGGNLGFSQRGRIEYALNGGRINTDAIDNAGGVDCSDHEVNIKVLLDAVVEREDLTGRQRNALLESMTEQVATEVLGSNYRQTLALSLMQARESALRQSQIRLLQALEAEGRLDRQLEFLPDDGTIAERAAGTGPVLSRPELSVLLAYAKLQAFDQILNSDLPDDDDLQALLFDYFPDPLPERFPADIRSHRLRREIIATRLGNDLLDQMGAGFLFRTMESTGRSVGDIGRAYLATRRLFAIDELWAALAGLDNRISGSALLPIRIHLVQAIEQGMTALLRHVGSGFSITRLVQQLRQPVVELAGAMLDLLPPSDQRRLSLQASEYQGLGLPEDLALDLSRLRHQLAVIPVSGITPEADLFPSLSVYWHLAERLELVWLGQAVDRLPTDTVWQERFQNGLRDDAARQHLAITRLILAQAETGTATAAGNRVESWLQAQGDVWTRLQRTLQALHTGQELDATMLSVGIQDLKLLGAPNTARAAPGAGD